MKKIGYLTAECFNLPRRPNWPKNKKRTRFISLFLLLVTNLWSSDFSQDSLFAKCKTSRWMGIFQLSNYCEYFDTHFSRILSQLFHSFNIFYCSKNLKLFVFWGAALIFDYIQDSIFLVVDF